MKSKINKKISLDEIKAVIFDMDGTLLTSQKMISPASQATIKKLMDKQKKVVLASGRPYYMILKEISQLDIQVPVISCNGALIYCPVQKTIIGSHLMAMQTSQYIYDTLVQHQATFVVYTTKAIYRYQFNNQSKWFDWLDQLRASLAAEFQFAVYDIADPADFDLKKHDIVKFLIISSEISQEQLSAIKTALAYLKTIYTVTSQVDVLDVMRIGSTKGEALKSFAEHGLIELNQTIVFGDADNDLSMFEVAQYAVAMGQAHQEVQDAASFVTTSNDEDGISHFFATMTDLD